MVGLLHPIYNLLKIVLYYPASLVQCTAWSTAGSGGNMMSAFSKLAPAFLEKGE